MYMTCQYAFNTYMHTSYYIYKNIDIIIYIWVHVPVICVPSKVQPIHLFKNNIYESYNIYILYYTIYMIFIFNNLKNLYMYDFQ